jgi:hypothetical protein
MAGFIIFLARIPRHRCICNINYAKSTYYFLRCKLMIVVLCGVFFIKTLSESKFGVGLYINFCFNLVLLLTWAVAVLLFKVNSSTKFIWGFACSRSNTFVNYNSVCETEVNLIYSLVTVDCNMGYYSCCSYN